jgi:hypothetical protein
MASSGTALFAHIAYQLAGVPLAELDSWLESAGIAVGAQIVRKAGATSSRVAGRRALYPSVRVDLDVLDLFCAVVRLKTTGGIFDEVADLPGVVELLHVEASGDLLVVVVYEQRSDQQQLRARLAEHGEVMSWEQCDAQTQAPAAATWRQFAANAAVAEGLNA